MGESRDVEKFISLTLILQEQKKGGYTEKSV